MNHNSEPCTELSSNTKISALESTLQQSLIYCQDLMKQFNSLITLSKEAKTQYITQKEKCESKLCSGSEELKRDIESKNNIIQSVTTALTKLNETKNFKILNDIFAILFGDQHNNNFNIPMFEPVTIKSEIKQEALTPKRQLFTPQKELFSPKKDVFSKPQSKDESVSEIEGTPTGRTSPIIQSRKLRNSSTSNYTDNRDKKKCPQSWPVSENKAVKLTFPSPTSTRNKNGKNVKLRQGRLNLIKMKPNNFVDLTSSPELMNMDRNSENTANIQLLVKKESTDNDDTILPSPTSGPNNFSSLCKATTMISPIKIKKPPLSLKSKSEIKMQPVDCESENIPIKDNSCMDNKTEDSINLLKPIRFLNALDENAPINAKPVDDDETHFEIPSSISLLEHVDMLEQKQDHGDAEKPISPSKQPLAENKNFANVPLDITDSSMSLLRPIKVSPTDDKVKRQLSCKRPPAPVEPIYKEQLPRTKIEKRKLPGWNCDECKNFYDELYKNDPDMLAKKMEECSKHRGKNNPARAKTPEGFWNPRWSVPRDTEEFNKRNNVG